VSSLALPRPSNLRGPWGELVTADQYHISERVQELDPNLYIYKFGTNGNITYAICEMCSDRVERLVYRTTALDGRVIERLQFLLHVPFAERLAEAEKIEKKAEEERKEAEHAELYERIGGPMLPDLERCGFIQRPKSYAKRGVTGGRGSRRRS
jgi:hypothetical protein